MGSKSPPRIFHDPALRSAVEQAFEATWTVLQARNPLRDFEQDNESKTALSRKLMGLAVDGVTDPIELREWALEASLDNAENLDAESPFGSLRRNPKRRKARWTRTRISKTDRLNGHGVHLGSTARTFCHQP